MERVKEREGGRGGEGHRERGRGGREGPREGQTEEEREGGGREKEKEKAGRKVIHMRKIHIKVIHTDVKKRQGKAVSEKTDFPSKQVHVHVHECGVSWVRIPLRAVKEKVVLGV